VDLYQQQALGIESKRESDRLRLVLRVSELEAENAKLREALVAAEKADEVARRAA
jgi:hypothetical protein